jgi:hypothetical protein
LKEKLTVMLGTDVFLDSDDLRDLRGLLDHVRNSDVLVVIQSAEVLEVGRRSDCCSCLHESPTNLSLHVAAVVPARGWSAF